MTYDGRKESVALWIPVDACRMVSVALRARLGSSLRAKYCKYTVIFCNGARATRDGTMGVSRTPVGQCLSDQGIAGQERWGVGSEVRFVIGARAFV